MTYEKIRKAFDEGRVYFVYYDEETGEGIGRLYTFNEEFVFFVTLKDKEPMKLPLSNVVKFIDTPYHQA